MELATLLQVERGITALIGGGGKTTLLYTLAEELRRRGTVVITTSTHIRMPEQYPVVLTGDVAAAASALAEDGVVCVASPGAGGKLTAPRIGFDALAALADYVLVEADGAKGLPLKAHASHEPVIPPGAGRVVCVVGADGFGRPVREVCHRPELYARLCGSGLDAPVTPAMAAQVLLAEGCGSGWVYINKVETAQDRRNASLLAAALTGTVIAGSLHRQSWQRL